MPYFHSRRAVPWAIVPALTLWVLLLPLVAAAQPQTLDERLRHLREGNVVERRSSLRWMADFGPAGAVPTVLESLKDADSQVRELAEFALWAIWARSGDPGVDQMLKTGTEIMTAGDPEAAIEIFDEIIRKRPEFAEGYNKRATAWYLLGAYQRSLADVRRTLKRNPAHFGALSGAGFCLIRLERLEDALFFLNRALRINPNLTTVRTLRDRIDRQVEPRAT